MEYSSSLSCYPILEEDRDVYEGEGGRWQKIKISGESESGTR